MSATDIIVTAMNLLADVSPVPSPSATAPQIDPNRVSPGIWGFLSWVGLIIVVVVIYFSMRKQLRRVDFEPGAPEAGSRRVDLIPPREIDTNTPNGSSRPTSGSN